MFLGVLQLGLSLGTAANLVFCSAASGHVAVESAFAADCCDRPPWAEAFAMAHGDDDCGCVDTPLLQSPVEPQRRSASTLRMPDAAIRSAATSLDAAAIALCRNDPRTHAPSDTQLSARRSVVLLV